MLQAVKLSLLALLAGTVWSWLGWQPSGPGLCATCGHNLLADQSCCPECGNKRAYYMQIQIRSADEPMTIFYKCTACRKMWSSN